MKIPRILVNAVSAGVTFIAVLRSPKPPDLRSAEDFTVSTLTTGLDTPWDMKWGPDGMIWLSERGSRITRIDPRTGAKLSAGTVPGVYQNGEGGLLGIALHPDFVRFPFVYAIHTYNKLIGSGNRLVRMRWNGRMLSAPEILFDGIVGAGIHDGSRIVVGKDGMLYISTGDAGAGDNAQDTSSLNGKILRLTLDGHPAPGNPFNNATWSYGHRNPQGLVFHPTTGVLYETEHGPSDNDEVNIITRGGNYGWPTVHGMCDDDNPGEKEFCRQHHVVEPLSTWTPTVAISGADLYLGNAIPSFHNSLLAASLAGSALWRLTLSADGTKIVSRVRLLDTYGRLRAVLVAPNGDVYVSTSNRDGRGSIRDGDDRILRLSAHWPGKRGLRKTILS